MTCAQLVLEEVRNSKPQTQKHLEDIIMGITHQQQNNVVHETISKQVRAEDELSCLMPNQHFSILS